METSYKEKYEQALAHAREIHRNEEEKRSDMEWLFPELKESGDEKVRKALIDFFSKGAKYGGYTNGVYDKDILAWLEKQGEKHPDPYNGISFEYNGHIWGMCARDNGVDISCDKHLIKHLDEQAEQKPADSYCQENCKGFQEIGKCFADGECKAKKEADSTNEVKPKFKVGDWLIFDENHNSVYQVERIDNYRYYLRHYLGGTMSVHFDNELIRLWTLQDAKSGDVLYSLDSKQPFIYKERPQFSQAIGYCCTNIFGEFAVWNTSKCVISIDKYIPATKEQRDLLFQKMNEAGYTFDFENKKLKKIEPKTKENKGNIGGISANWSVEDMSKVQRICKYLNEAKKYYADITEVRECIEWLKSLQDRVQPQPKQGWRAEDEAVLDALIRRLKGENRQCNG